MKNDFTAKHLNIEAFALNEGSLEDHLPLAAFERLVDETSGMGADRLVHFSAQGEMQRDSAGGAAPWLYLHAEVVLPLTCQRCLGAVDVPLAVQCDFRFVATEALAEAQDEESEEDVLVISRDFNLLELIEDELLMALPPMPKHDQCPSPIQMEAKDANFAESGAEKPNPFAILESLKKKPSS